MSKRQERDIPTKRGGVWRQSTIKSILTNPIYIGNVRYGLRKKNNFEVPGKDIVPIVDREIFFKVQKSLIGREANS